ncbi:MAG: VIT and VWA domain-containing protein [Myxococcota bacterium]|jgi:Ca-activated chloride channel family protein|nr:VIT and VWA domain-containing protein [Myxococcota bacterium]
MKTQWTRATSWVGSALLVMALLATAGRAQAAEGERFAGENAEEDKTLSPYFFVEKGDHATDSFPLKDTSVKVTVTGVIADVVVQQTYTNEGKVPINASYVFPASTRASVHGLKMTIGEQVVTAKIKERGEAAATFAQAKAEGKSASLLEQQRPNVFTMSVANILPGDLVLIELHYSELLIPSEGTYEFVYPTVVGPRYANQPAATAPESDRWVQSPYLHEGQTPPTTFEIELSLSTGIPLQEVTSPSHEVSLSWQDESVASVTLAKPEEFGGNRDFVLRYRLAGKEMQSGLLLYEGEHEKFFLLMVQPPERIETAQIPPREYIFIIDVSGSMNGFPLDTAKELIHDLIGGLRPTDTFNVILFSGDSELLAPASLPASPENVARARRLIDAQRGGGGTELSAALRRALSLPRTENVARTAILLTDGYIAAEKEAFALVSQNLNSTNVFAFGIGSSVNRYLIEGIARAGQGEPFVVTKPAEAQGTAARFRDYVGAPLLTQARVRYHGFEAYDVEPQALPDLFARRPLVLFGKWRGRPAGSIEVTGRTSDGTYARTFAVAQTRPLAVNRALRPLWARTRVARLSDHNLSAEDDQTKREIVELGLAYSLLTPFTSFVAVLETVRNPQRDSKDVSQPQPLALGVSDLAVGGLSAMPEPELYWLLGALALILLLASRRAASSGRVRG